MFTKFAPAHRRLFGHRGGGLRELHEQLGSLSTNSRQSHGTNEIAAEINVGPKDAAKHAFVFRYGTVNLSSTPPGATVLRKGKEIGKAPLTIERVHAGDMDLEFRLSGYESVRHSIGVLEGQTTRLAAKLFSEQYVQAMKDARVAFDAAQFSESQRLLAAALESEPDDPAALRLRNEVAQATARAAEALRAEQVQARAREIAAMPWLDFDQIVKDCTDTRQVQVTVNVPVGHNEEYVDKNNKKRTRFVQTGTRQETQTQTQSTFNYDRFGEKYRGRMFRFNCPDRWSVAKIEKDGGIILKAGGAGSVEIKATAPPGNPGALSSVQQGQKVTIKGALTRFEPAGFFVPASFHLGNAEILDMSVLSESKALLVDPPAKSRQPAPSAGANSEISDSPAKPPVAAPEAGEAKVAANTEVPDISSGPSLEETQAWLQNELPRLGSFSIVSLKNDGQSSPATATHSIGSVLLSAGQLSIRRTMVAGTPARTSTYTDTAVLKDIDVSKIQVRETPVATGYTHRRPSYYVPLAPLPNRAAALMVVYQLGDQPPRETKPMQINVRVGDKEAANQLAKVLRRAAILSGAPNPPSGAADGESAPKPETSQASPRDTTSFSGAAVFDISKLDQTPVPRFQARPQYPFEMRRAGIAGEVLVDLLVDTDGNVQNAYSIRSSRSEFEAAAVAAVSKWKFKPGRKGGRDVVTHMQIPIVFSLNQE